MSTFRLKQFEIRQDKSALKVGTDSTLLGAYAADCAIENVKRILDVGTGTGIIALMLAQKYHAAHIDGIELDRLSAEEAAENFKHSPWGERLQVFHHDFLLFDAPSQYDLIVSNPPYFTDTHYNENDRETTAKHMQSLPPELFFTQCHKLLSDTDESQVFTITSASSIDRFINAAKENSFSPERHIFIHPRNGAEVHRIISVWKRGNIVTKSEHLDILIGKGRHDYSPEFSRLLSPYLIILPDF